MNKIAIYVFYEKNSEVRDYVTYYINGLKEVAKDILVVINGDISSAGLQKLKDLNVEVLQRENIGFDFAAYKAGIEYIGYDKLKNYNELILTNNNYYGPIYPFSEMFDEMAKRECDFWGINRHPEVKDEKYNSFLPMKNQQEIMIDDFLVFRQQCFEIICNNLELNSLDNLKSDTFMSFDKYKKLICDDPRYLSYSQIKDDKSPIIHREYFCDFRKYLNYYCVGYQPKLAMDFIKNNTDYNIDLIWEDLLRSHYMSDLNESLSLNYDLPSDNQYSNRSDKKIAVIAYIYSLDVVDDCFKYLKNIPNYIDLIIVNVSDEVQNACKMKFNTLMNRQIYKLQPNRGRDNAAILVTCKNIVFEYDYICFVHGKKSPYFKSAIIGEEFREHNFISLLYSEEYINNIIYTLDSNTRLGLLIPTVLDNKFHNIINFEWATNYSNAKDFIKNHLNLDLDLDPFVMAPFGGMFWAKISALKTLFSYNWQYESFQEEPLRQKDGLINHVIERIISVLAQHDGYYISWVAPDFYFSNSYNMFYNKYKNLKAKNSINYFKYIKYKLLRFFKNKYKIKYYDYLKIKNYINKG